MMCLVAFLLLLVSAPSFTFGQMIRSRTTFNPAHYTNFKTLDNNKGNSSKGALKLYWQIFSNEYIEMMLVSGATGWVSIGVCYDTSDYRLESLANCNYMSGAVSGGGMSRCFDQYERVTNTTKYHSGASIVNDTLAPLTVAASAGSNDVLDCAGVIDGGKTHIKMVRRLTTFDNKFYKAWFKNAAGVDEIDGVRYDLTIENKTQTIVWAFADNDLRCLDPWSSGTACSMSHYAWGWDKVNFFVDGRVSTTTTATSTAATEPTETTTKITTGPGPLTTTTSTTEPASPTTSPTTSSTTTTKITTGPGPLTTTTSTNEPSSPATTSTTSTISTGPGTLTTTPWPSSGPGPLTTSSSTWPASTTEPSTTPQTTSSGTWFEREFKGYKLRWSLTNGQIDFEISAPTNGWVGIGFSGDVDLKVATNHQKTATYVGWVDATGTTTLVNGYSLYELVQPATVSTISASGREMQGTTTIKFSRRLRPTPPSDMTVEIENREMLVSWAWGEADGASSASTGGKCTNEDGTMSSDVFCYKMHKDAGVVRLNLFSPDAMTTATTATTTMGTLSGATSLCVATASAAVALVVMLFA